MKKLFTGEFKKNVVLEALKEEKTISELASENEIDSRQIFRWKKLVIERIEIEKLNGILSSQVVYTFDDYNNRKSMMNNDVMTDYEYDKNNRLINEVKVNNEITETTKYFYDNNGNQIYKGIDIIAPDDGSDASIGMSVVGTNTESSSVYNEYDGLNQLISTAVHDKVVLYSYDSDGLRASKSVNGSKTDYIWDGQNIVAEINNGTLTNKYIRGINLIYGENVTGIKKWYLFNGHGDVVGLSDVNGNVSKLYDYDAFGNLCQEQNYKVLANILEDDFSTGLEKWDNTRIASIISDGGLRVDYNELVRSKNTINGDFVFEVDVKIQKSSAGIVFRGVDNYNYYMWQLTNGKLRPHKKVNNGWTVLKEVPASITENVVYHVKIEVVGNVIKTYINENLVDTTMDSTFSNGTVGFREAPFEVGVFDNVVVKSLQDSSEVVAVNPFRYCGEFWDAETGEYYLRARYYDPVQGRFISEDSYLGKINNPLSLNLYVYCGNNPVNRIDPSGHVYQYVLQTMESPVGQQLFTEMEYALLMVAQYAGMYGQQAVTMIGNYGVVASDTIVNMAQGAKEAGKNLVNWAKDKFGSSSNGDPGKDPRWNKNSTRVTSKTLYNKNGVRLDVENPNPAQRIGQLHVQSGNNKYIFDNVTKNFFDVKTGNLAPKNIQELMQNTKFMQKLNDGLTKYLG